MLLSYGLSKELNLVVASYGVEESLRFCIGPRPNRSGAQESQNGAMQILPVLIVALPFSTPRPCRERVGPQLKSIHFGEQFVHKSARPTYRC
jgi:hypothetical protein